MRNFSALIAAALLAAPIAQAQVPADLQLVNVQSGFSGITAVRAPHDGSGRLFVVEQGGSVKIYDGATTLATPFLRLCTTPGSGCFVPTGGFTSGGERGLLGLAFHPEYPTDPRVFVYYTNGAGHTIVASVDVSTGNANLANTASFQEVIRVDQDFSNHNGGDIHFGPDGYLYIGLGDGGSGNDPCSRSQTMRASQLVTGGSCGSSSSRALLGKMLRIDVDATTGTGSNNLCAAAGNGSANYAIPADNPYANDDTGICAEIWAAGLRNPWRFSFDRLTGDMWIGDVGQNAREEVNLEPAGVGGRNYGWRCREASLVNFTNAPYCNDSALVATFIPPVMEYNLGGGNCAVTGGFRYRGPATSLQGRYFFADVCRGRLLVATEGGGGSWTFVDGPTIGGSPRTFGEDEQGRLYIGAGSTLVLVTGDIAPASFTVTPSAGPGGSIDPGVPQEVLEGESVDFEIIADPFFVIDSVSGCGGSLLDTTYSTAAITADCEVTASFVDDGDRIFYSGFEAED